MEKTSKVESHKASMYQKDHHWPLDDVAYSTSHTSFPYNNVKHKYLPHTNTQKFPVSFHFRYKNISKKMPEVHFFFFFFPNASKDSLFTHELAFYISKAISKD